MQNEIVITLSLYALGAALLGYTLYRAIITAYSRGYAAGSINAASAHEPLMAAQKQATAAAWQDRDLLSQAVDLLNIRAHQQQSAASETLASANALIDHLKTENAQLVAVTHQEIGLLVQAENMIKLAHRTWAAMKGVEPTARKASSVHQKLAELNARLSENAIRASVAGNQEQAA